MDLKVEQVLRGPADTRSLLVTGDNGSECRHYVTQFPVGTRWVFALSQYSSTADLGISRCAEAALFYDGAAVTGVVGAEASVVTDHFLGAETIPLAELQLRLSGAR